MNPSNIILIGCGAQAKYALDIFSYGNLQVSHVFDPVGNKIGRMINGYHIEDFKAFKSRMNTWDSKVKKSIVICLKDNQKKAELFNLLKNKFAIINAIHPDSTISPTSNLGMGIIVNAKAVIRRSSDWFRYHSLYRIHCGPQCKNR
jgi:hypothetical protein